MCISCSPISLVLNQYNIKIYNEFLEAERYYEELVIIFLHSQYHFLDVIGANPGVMVD